MDMQQTTHMWGAAGPCLPACLLPILLVHTQHSAWGTRSHCHLNSSCSRKELLPRQQLQLL